MNRTLHDKLRERGVLMPAPDSVYLAPDVDPARIAPGVVIHPGCRLSGAQLSIGPAAVLGAEAPMTVVDCQLGAHVRLAGGFAERSTFLDGFQAGSGAHIRPGCLFEEESSIAHGVGAKQTVFFPWVTAGSLINFCDALMAGGTGRKDHSEIGSSYVHFNFTPHQDKATPSLLGDVPRGVLLNQPAIFLGGQGGLVGPCAIAFGTVIPAGQVWRGDVTAPGHLVARPTFAKALDTAYDPRQYHSLDRLLRNNLLYIGNLAALDVWYSVVRARFMRDDPFQAACHDGARRRLAEMLDERMKRLDELAGKVADSVPRMEPGPSADAQSAFVGRWPAMKASLERLLAERDGGAVPETVRGLVAALPPGDYIRAIRDLPPEAARQLTEWLDAWLQHCACLNHPT